MANINRNPAGALELLNLNLQGEFPRALSSMVVPDVQMNDFFLAGIGVSQAQNTATIVAPNNGLGITVPAGEIWALRAIGLRVQSLEAANMLFASSIQWGRPGNFDVALVSESATLGAAQFVEICKPFERTLMIYPGDAIRGRINAMTFIAAGVTCVLNVAYHRLSLS